MRAFHKEGGPVQPQRGAGPMRLFFGLTAIAALAGALVLTRSEAEAQSADTGQKTPASAPAGNAQRGKTMYTKIGCYECHAWDGQSGGNTGPKLGPNPLPYAAFSYQVRSPRNAMPPYTAKVLSDTDLADIYAFVQSLPQPPKIDSIPLLK